MATIEQDLLAIRKAVYGREIREAIADGIETCYEEVAAPGQIARIEQRANEIIASLPQDYTELNDWLKKQLYVTLAAAHVSQYWIPDEYDQYNCAALDGTITSNGLTITRENGFITLNGTLSAGSNNSLYVKLWPRELEVGVAQHGSQAMRDLLMDWSYNPLREYYDDRHTDLACAHLFCPLVSGTTTVLRGTRLVSAIPPTFEWAAAEEIPIGWGNMFYHMNFGDEGRQLFLELGNGTYTNYKFLPTFASNGTNFYINGTTLQII